MDEIVSKPTLRIRKGDAFVQMDSHPLVFMEVNEVEESTDSMDFCIVTWYMLNKKGLNVQQRFPMAARDGKFSNFESISRSLLKDAKRLLTKNKEISTLISAPYNTYFQELKRIKSEFNNSVNDLANKYSLVTK